MSKRNPEIRLLMKILAIAGFIILLVLIGGYIFVRVRAPHLLDLEKGVEEYRVELSLDSLESGKFYTGMTGCENLWADPEGNSLYVTTLDGFIHKLDGPSTDSLENTASMKAGTSVAGITKVSDTLFAAVIYKNSPDDWVEIGGAVCLVPFSLDTLYQLTEEYPAANGLCSDTGGNLYFASSNFDFLDPEGNLYLIWNKGNGNYNDPVALPGDPGLANGLFYDPGQDRVYYSNTIDGVFSFAPVGKEFRKEYRKVRFMESFDDLCTDISGNIWMTDPGYSTVKFYNPGTDRLIRFVIQGIGQTSSCRIRNESGQEILYLTELKKEQKPFSSDFDGRGVLRVSVKELLGLVEMPQNVEK